MLMIQNDTYYPKFPTYGPYYGSPINHYTDYNTPAIPNNTATSYSHNHQNHYPPQTNYNIQPQQYYNQNGPPAFVDHQTIAAVIIPPIVHSIWWNHRDKNTNRPAFPYLPQNRFHRIQKRQVTTDENQVGSKVTKRCSMRSQKLCIKLFY